MQTALITGTSRGLGLGLATEYAERGWRVIATSRHPEAAALQELGASHPDQVCLHRLDVSDPSQIEALGSLLRRESLDLLINNAGAGDRLAQLADVTYESWERALRVNSFATLKLAQVLGEQVARSRKKTMVTISSQMGSIALNESGGRYAYRASKAAANMIVRTLAADLAPRGVIVVSLHPGWVRTVLGGPHAALSVEESARGLAAVIESLTPAHSGRFFDYRGQEIPW